MKIFDIKDYLNSSKAISKKELSDLTGLDERSVRAHISDLKMTEPVIFSSHKRGYRLAKDINNASLAELEEEVKAVEHCLREIESRKRVYNMQERTYIAYKAVALKRIGKLKGGI